MRSLMWKPWGEGSSPVISPAPGLGWRNINQEAFTRAVNVLKKHFSSWVLGAGSAVSCENGSCLVHCSFLVSALQGKISNHPNPMCTASCGAGLLLSPLCVFLFQGGRIPSLSSSSTMSWAWAGWRWRWAPLAPHPCRASGEWVEKTLKSESLCIRDKGQLALKSAQ